MLVKLLVADARILIFDEPTSVLTPAESRELFAVLRRVVQEEQRAVALPEQSVRRGGDGAPQVCRD